MKIVACEQGSDGWVKARLGMATASEFGTVMASGRDGGPSLTRKTYLYKLAGEIITGEQMDNYTNQHFDRGKAMEDEARAMYVFMHDAEVERCGFIVNDLAGYSPDSLVGVKGLVEIKTKLPHLMVETILKDQFPPENKPQCQGGLWVSEREWIDLVCYWPKMPLFVKRAYRDEAYIKKIEEAVRAFNAELQELVTRIRSVGGIHEKAA